MNRQGSIIKTEKAEKARAFFDISSSFYYGIVF